jgi:hypothetical protein
MKDKIEKEVVLNLLKDQICDNCYYKVSVARLLACFLNPDLNCCQRWKKATAIIYRDLALELTRILKKEIDEKILESLGGE